MDVSNNVCNQDFILDCDVKNNANYFVTLERWSPFVCWTLCVQQKNQAHILFHMCYLHVCNI